MQTFKAREGKMEEYKGPAHEALHALRDALDDGAAAAALGEALGRLMDVKEAVERARGAGAAAAPAAR